MPSSSKLIKMMYFVLISFLSLKSFIHTKLFSNMLLLFHHVAHPYHFFSSKHYLSFLLSFFTFPVPQSLFDRRYFWYRARPQTVQETPLSYFRQPVVFMCLLSCLFSRCSVCSGCHITAVATILQVKQFSLCTIKCSKDRMDLKICVWGPFLVYKYYMTNVCICYLNTLLKCI